MPIAPPETEWDDDDIELDDEFTGGDTFAAPPAQEAAPAPERLVPDDEDDWSDTLDLAALLRDEAARRPEAVSPIDEMEANGQTVIDITLEQLIQYNREKERAL